MQQPEKFEDQNLLLRVAEGDGTAFTELVTERSPILYNFIFKLTKSEHITEEILQDVFTNLWLTRENLKAVNNIHAYLFTVARNHVFYLLKKTQKERELKEEWMRTQDVVIESPSDQENRMKWLQEAIEQLSPQQKKVWELNRRQRKKYKEVASEMNISVETVKSYLQIANASITNYLKKRMDLIIIFILFFL